MLTKAQQIPPSPCLFTGDCDTCSTVDPKTSLVPLKEGNLHAEVTVWRLISGFRRENDSLLVHTTWKILLLSFV